LSSAKGVVVVAASSKKNLSFLAQTFSCAGQVERTGATKISSFVDIEMREVKARIQTN